MNPEIAAREAARILESEVYQQAVKDAGERIKHEWTQAMTAEARDALWHQFRARDAVTRELRSIRDRGKARPQETTS